MQFISGLYLSHILMVDLLFSEAWEVPGCGLTEASPSSARIIGGRPQNISEVPWQVLLKVGEQFLCGGSILQPHWILTAAHCLKHNNRLIDAQVFAGITNRLDLNSDFCQRPKVKQVLPHKDYIDIFHDIALIQLETPLQFNERVSAICQPREHDRMSGTAMATGWGLIQPNMGIDKFDIPKALQMVDLDLFTLIECSKAYSAWIPPYIVCAGSKDKNDKRSTCSGDSGGPLAVTMTRDQSDVWVLVGLTSFGYKKGCGIRPDLYTRVLSYERWIDHVITCTESGNENCLDNGSLPLFSAKVIYIFGIITSTRHLVLFATNLAVYVF